MKLLQLLSPSQLLNRKLTTRMQMTKEKKQMVKEKVKKMNKMRCHC